MPDLAKTAPVADAKPAQQAPRGGFYLFAVRGINVTINYSWLIIFALVTVSLSWGYFPRYFPDYGPQLYWLAGLTATLLFFASILIHELSHSLTAVRLGIKIPEITLFMFGGVAHLSEEPADPKAELKIAVAGPLASFSLALFFWLIKIPLQGPAPVLLVAIFDYLAWINLALGVFNLIPGYPLDGGRIFRAIVWWKTGSLTWATKWASDIGQGFAWALMILGVVQVFGGGLVGGLWLILIGMFLKGMAVTGYQETMIRQSLEGVGIEQVIFENLVTVPPDLSLEKVAEDYFLRYGHGGFPVVQDGHALGLISLANVTTVPRDERADRTVRDVMTPRNDEMEIVTSESLLSALKKMNRSGMGRLLVVEGGALRGMITNTRLLRFIEIKRNLEG